LASSWQEKLPQAEVWSISATESFRVLELRERIVSLLPNHPPFFPKDQITDKPERFFVNEAIREQILLRYQKEIPYAVEVLTERFEETENIIRIRSVIVVERNSQKGIVVGSKGSAIKHVGVEARKTLETFFNKKIHLELFVKVNKNWRSNHTQLQRFGYSSSQKK
ncbi:MAG: GTPase Era, partial [Flavobacteriaceae bacterium]